VPANPYRGLHAFQEADVDYFFGRTTATELLVQAVNRQPLVAVIGASGSGKSSLVFAGLVPRLRQRQQWLIVSCRPKDQPFYQLALALVQFFYTDPLARAEKLSRFHQGLNRGEISLKSIVDSSLLDQPNQRLLLIIDQFEELYTLNPLDVQTAFVNSLIELIPLTPPSTLNSTVVLTLRADFMNQAVSHVQLAQALNTYPSEILGPMTVAELRAVIEQPAARQGVELEEGLTDRILKELEAAPGYLPLLEFALTQLWEQHHCH
jgi:ABC-type dipeptide/oligopeptide/nickel transport system ATPase component